MAVNIRNGDLIFIKTAEGWLNYCEEERRLVFVENLSEATLCTIFSRKNNAAAGDVIQLKENIDISIKVGSDFALIRNSKDSAHKKCGKELTVSSSGDIMSDNELQTWGNTGQGGNAIYGTSYLIGKSTRKKWGACIPEKTCGSRPVLDREGTDDGKGSPFTLYKANSDGGIDEPTEPGCGSDCSPSSVYIVNYQNQVLSVQSDSTFGPCVLRWETHNLSNTAQKWYSKEGIRGNQSFYKYYNAKYYTELSKVENGDLLVLGQWCFDYFPQDKYAEWRMQDRPKDGERVMRLGASSLDVGGEFFLAKNPDNSAVTVTDINAAIPCTVNVDPVYEYQSTCFELGKTCASSLDCCGHDGEGIICGQKNKCVDPEDDNGTAIFVKWWHWLLIGLGGLLFAIVIYKIAKMISKTDTSKFYEKKHTKKSETKRERSLLRDEEPMLSKKKKQ